MYLMNKIKDIFSIPTFNIIIKTEEIPMTEYELKSKYQKYFWKLSESWSKWSITTIYGDPVFDTPFKNYDFANKIVRLHNESIEDMLNNIVGEQV